MTAQFSKQWVDSVAIVGDRLGKAWIKRLRSAQKSVNLKIGVGLALGLLLASCDVVLLTDSGVSEAAGAAYEQGLAEHLRQTGAKMYGAYWCPHCADQKALFGAAAVDLPYVECDPRGENPQPNLCQAKQIEGYPTWEIEGQFYAGVRSPIELATLSHYEVAPSKPKLEVNPVQP